MFDSQELLVFDSNERCPYLPGRVARMPLRRPLVNLSGEEFDRRLASGDRRTGAFLYNTSCAACHACEPIRLPVREFRPNSTQRRVWRRGSATLRREEGRPQVDARRVLLFNQHRQERGLNHDQSNIDAFSYEHFLVQTCCETFELRYFLEDELIAVAICDVGRCAMSAVYTYFAPEHQGLSIGVFSILSQIEWCRDHDIEFLYLGYYVEGSSHMVYKSNYKPHERLVNGVWQRFARGQA